MFAIVSGHLSCLGPIEAMAMQYFFFYSTTQKVSFSYSPLDHYIPPASLQPPLPHPSFNYAEIIKRKETLDIYFLREQNGKTSENRINAILWRPSKTRRSLAVLWPPAALLSGLKCYGEKKRMTKWWWWWWSKKIQRINKDKKVGQK